MASASWRERLGQPVVRASLFQFVLYMSPAVMVPYQAIWMAEKGIDKASIGLINAAPFAVVILLNFFVGRIADRATDWRQVIVIGAIIAGLTSFSFLFAVDFWTIMMAMMLVMVPFQLILPVVDSATMRMCRRRNLDFGRVRVWGTLGFVPVTLLTGVAINHFGFEIFVPLIIGVCVVRAFVALQLPRFRPTEEEKAASELEGADAKPDHPLVSKHLRDIFQPWFLLPLIGTGLLHSSHMMQMSMGTLVWKEAGIPESLIGMMWAVAPASELVMLLAFSKIAKRFSARHILLVGCAVACLRWTGLGLQPDIFGIVVLQALNMFTFAMTYLAILSFIANWTTDDIGAQAQSIFSMIRQFFMIIGLAGFGALAGAIGADSYYVAAGVAAAGSILIAASLFIMSPKSMS